MKKKLVSLLSVALAVCLLVSCSQGGGEGSSSGSSGGGGTIRLAIGGGNSTSTGYMVCSGMATIIDEHVDNVYASVEAATGDIEEIKLLNDDEIQIAIAMLDGAWYAYQGVETYEEVYENIRLMLVGNCSDLQLVVAADSDIYSVADLKGKRVGCGSPSSGCATIMVPSVLGGYGLTYDDIDAQYLGQSECLDAMSDGTIDAAFMYTAYPASALSELSYSKDIRLISLDEEVFNELQATSEWFVYEKIPAGTYNGVDEDVYCVGVPTVLITNSSVPEDVIYNIVKSTDEKQEEWASIHRSAAFYTPENTASVGNSLLPLHPGVQKYLEEKGLL